MIFLITHIVITFTERSIALFRFNVASSIWRKSGISDRPVAGCPSMASVFCTGNIAARVRGEDPHTEAAAADPRATDAQGARRNPGCLSQFQAPHVAHGQLWLWAAGQRTAESAGTQYRW